jgi:predicted aspartyl protease
MDIDVVRLENAKDLLSLEGKVNGISVQCLADTCANASFIQKRVSKELGLNIDENVKHDIRHLVW